MLTYGPIRSVRKVEESHDLVLLDRQPSAEDVRRAPLALLLLAVAYGASCAFVLPFAHQCNLMVMGPGGYRTRDFARVGIGLSIVMAVTAVAVLALA